MNYNKLINFFLKEGAYTQKRSGMLSGGTKSGSNIGSDKVKDADSYLKSKFVEFYKNPKDITTIRDILATISGMDTVGVIKKSQTKREFLLGILGHIKRKTGMDFADIIPDGQEFSNGNQLTIDQWKSKYGAGSEVMYTAIRDILNSEEFNLSTQGRNVREAEGGEQIEVFYFAGPKPEDFETDSKDIEDEPDREGEPIRTTVFVDSQGIAPKGAFWATNRFNKAQAPKPAYVSPEDGKTYVGYNPKVFMGADIQTIKKSVNHEDAKKAFEAKYPRKENPSMYSFGGKKKESEADLPLIQTIKPQLQTK
jgi:hypothetical protein